MSKQRPRPGALVLSSLVLREDLSSLVAVNISNCIISSLNRNFDGTSVLFGARPPLSLYVYLAFLSRTVRNKNEAINAAELIGNKLTKTIMAVRNFFFLPIREHKYVILFYNIIYPA